jgi:hypothetical protein
MDGEGALGDRGSHEGGLSFEGRSRGLAGLPGLSASLTPQWLLVTPVTLRRPDPRENKGESDHDFPRSDNFV